MVERQSAFEVFVHESEGWTSHCSCAVETSRNAFDELRFARAELTAESQHVTGA